MRIVEVKIIFDEEDLNVSTMEKTDLLGEVIMFVRNTLGLKPVSSEVEGRDD